MIIRPVFRIRINKATSTSQSVAISWDLFINVAFRLLSRWLLRLRTFTIIGSSESGNSSGPTTEKTSSVYQRESVHLQELNQHSDRHQESPSLSQTDNGSAQQPDYTNSGDYYPEEHDWRAEPQPIDVKGNFADSYCVGLDQLSSNEELINWESYFSLSP